MNDDYKDTMLRLIIAAKTILYDAKRMQPLLGMMSTKDGALNAVHTVMAAIQRKKPIPSDMAPLVGVSILMLIVDVAKQVTGKSPAPALLNDVAKTLMQNVGEAHPPLPKSAPMPDLPTSAPQQQPQGIIQGAAA